MPKAICYIQYHVFRIVAVFVRLLVLVRYLDREAYSSEAWVEWECYGEWSVGERLGGVGCTLFQGSVIHVCARKRPEVNHGNSESH
jgi:hypothetical protein